MEKQNLLSVVVADDEQELQHLLTGYCRIIQKPPFAGHTL